MASKKQAKESSAPAATKTRSRSTTRKKAPSKSRATKSKGEGAQGTAPSPAVSAGHVVVEREIGGRKLTLETGRMAKLSDGAVVARYGDTMVLAAVNSSKAPDGIDFFPLTVDYREKTAAAGMIPGGFFKREGRPTTKEILACRIIDRSIRPMFPDGFKRDVQVLSQVLSADRENDPDVLAAVASFAALALSSLPHGRTLGMVRIGLVDDKLVVNPLWSQSQSESCKLNLTVAGHSDAIVMVEAGAKEVGESKMIEALEMAREVAREIVDMIEELRAKAGKPKMEFTPPQVDAKVATAIDKQFGKALREAPLTLGPKQVRGAAIKAARDEAKAAFPAPAGSSDTEAKVWDTMVSGIITKIVKQSERDSILSGRRADGRDSQTIRPITIEVGVLPCTHGSVLFTRGETQALAVVTLAGTDAQQIIDGLMPEPRKRFLLHYSFPPFSVGETKRVLAPGRREIGHGALAERGLEPVLPAKDEFAYTIRVTSEILESNGSSSMATACGGTLAMMDAGVPIKQPVAGIAMGLVMEGKKYTVLSDILGSEDGCGDMDFKVVGTGRGITALQMDIKCEGLTREILAEALEQARQGRLHILREMLKAIKKPRAQLSPNAPRLVSVQVPADKIGMIIGPGGKNIRNLQEQYECKIAIEDSGLCTITGLNGEKVDACLEYIGAMTAEVELGSVYTGRVTAIKEFGAFVEILPGQEGLVHVSELSHEFIKAVTDVVRIGDEVKVKVIAIDDFGKIKLSRKALLEGGGADSGGGGRGGDEERERRPRRENDDRPARADREDRPARDDRPVRAGHHDRGDRPARGGRPEREDRPRRDDRPEREDRPMRAERSERPVRERGERRPWGDREARGGDWDDDRDSRRSARAERPVREDRGGRRAPIDRDEGPVREDRLDEAPPRHRHDRPERSERPGRGGRGPRRDDIEVWSDDEEFDAPRSQRAPERFGREGDRPRRAPRHDRADGPVPEREPHRDYDEAGGRGRGRHDRGESHRPERPVRSERPSRDERHDRAERRARPDREERAERPERIERPDRPERAERPDRPERSGRGGRGGRPAPARGREDRSMPMAEFDDDEPQSSFVRGGEDVGELESIDSLLGEEAPRRDRPRRGGRRPRRD